jgi:chlorite dismutase
MSQELAPPFPGADPVYTLYPAFRAGPRFRDEMTEPDHLAAATREVEQLIEVWDGRVHLRGAYSTAGFRTDTDLMLWLVATTPQDLQTFLVEFRRTRAGRRLDVSHTFMGVTKPAEFTADHVPSFAKGVPPKLFACVYPFVRTPEWYLLPSEERAAMLREHGLMGREFPEVLPNTTNAFGLGDWEWILAFESDDAAELVDCIRRLRDAEARRFTQVEIPFVTGIRKPVAEALADLA